MLKGISSIGSDEFMEATECSTMRFRTRGPVDRQRGRLAHSPGARSHAGMSKPAKPCQQRLSVKVDNVPYMSQSYFDCERAFIHCREVFVSNGHPRSRS